VLHQKLYNKNMAIVRPTSSNTNSKELTLTFNNGDFEILRETAQRLGFRDEESMMRFALAALARSATRSLSITDQNGTKVNLNPSQELLRPESSE